MAKHLDNRDINAIVNLIRGWQEPKLSWSAICEAAEPLVGKLPSRQSLSAHEAIVAAYQTKKEALKGRGRKNPRPASLNIAAARIVNLGSEIEELKEENRRYKQQFVIWQYNAYKHGMAEHQLNAPLTKIDRERSDGEKR
ncbi:hypothetical protein R2Y32_005512 [Klebsiella pneumoniae]|uniref:hypothetical protein n=1 Tax=Martelella alba TaxID=2590451 RepID=UPI0018AD4856|nr:hypothetical protein [Martelella alba]EIX9406541.1 hypothetical protein [Klebsiella pneumoniae]ELI9610806.1 hypothetical protein [Klebsiella pneumoniae]ELQ4544165.1 hypothetical protein [Klebsiella pneumoniae]HBR2785177.1 hypothetical protein [Klebsiella pneumoniae]HBS6382410.1 hypothetical protein [Klebsiella pneumoniae]